MQIKPEHKDIKKYGYDLEYSVLRDRWYATYEADKRTVWFIWNDSASRFKQIEYSMIPDDI